MENFSTTSGVKQGSIYSIKLLHPIDPTIDAVDALGPDDWLESTCIPLGYLHQKKKCKPSRRPWRQMELGWSFTPQNDSI